MHDSLLFNLPFMGWQISACLRRGEKQNTVKQSVTLGFHFSLCQTMPLLHAAAGYGAGFRATETHLHEALCCCQEIKQNAQL